MIVDSHFFSKYFQRDRFWIERDILYFVREETFKKRGFSDFFISNNHQFGSVKTHSRYTQVKDILGYFCGCFVSYFKRERFKSFKWRQFDGIFFLSCAIPKIFFFKYPILLFCNYCLHFNEKRKIKLLYFFQRSG